MCFHDFSKTVYSFCSDDVFCQVLRACAGECKWLTAHNAEVSEKLEAATRLLRQWEERLRPEHDAEIARLHQELADLDRCVPLLTYHRRCF